MRISSLNPRPIPPAASRKFQLLHPLAPNLHDLVDNASVSRSRPPKISHPMFDPKLDPKLSPTPNPMFNLPPRPLRHRVHRRFAVDAVVAAVAAVAVAANRPLRKPSPPLP